MSKALFEAVKNDNIEELKRLIDDGVNLHARDEYERTLLHCVAKSNAIDIAKLLIEKGVDIYTYDEYKLTPLHWTAIYNAVEIAKLLIEKGADVNAQDEEGKTPLQYAVDRGNTELAAILEAAVQKKLLEKTHLYAVTQSFIAEIKEKGISTVFDWLDGWMGKVANAQLRDEIQSNYGELPPGLQIIHAHLHLQNIVVNHAKSVGRAPSSSSDYMRNNLVAEAAKMLNHGLLKRAQELTFADLPAQVQTPQEATKKVAKLKKSNDCSM